MVVNKEGKIEMTPQELADLKKVIYYSTCTTYPTYPTYPTLSSYLSYLSYSSPTISFPDNYPWIYYSTSADGALVQLNI